MPVSPFRRAAEEGLNQPESSSSASGKKKKPKRKRKSKPTSKKRAQKQRTKDRYAHAREDAQLEGLIPTTPEEALSPEQVNPAIQTGSALPELVRQALRESWATPNAAKPAIIAALLEPFFQEDVALDENGQQVKIKPSRKLLMELAKTLRVLDQTQWERDNPGKAGQARGGGSGNIGGNTTNFNLNTNTVIQNNIQAAALIREAIERGDLGILEEMPAPDLAGTPGSGGHERALEGSTAPTDHQQCTGEGVADSE